MQTGANKCQMSVDKSEIMSAKQETDRQVIQSCHGDDGYRGGTQNHS